MRPGDAPSNRCHKPVAFASPPDCASRGLDSAAGREAPDNSDEDDNDDDDDEEEEAFSVCRKASF